MTADDAGRVERLEREVKKAQAAALLAVAISLHRPRKKTIGDRLWDLL